MLEWEKKERWMKQKGRLLLMRSDPCAHQVSLLACVCVCVCHFHQARPLPNPSAVKAH